MAQELKKSPRRTGDYISQMAGELAEMACNDDLPMVAFLLKMVVLEIQKPSNVPLNKEDININIEIVPCLREQANFCIKLSRKCSDLVASHKFEEIGTDLMLKAEELENLLDIG